MARRRVAKPWLALALVVASALGFAAWRLLPHLVPEHSPAERGVAAARELGCWTCHAGGGRKGPPPTAPSLFAGSREPAKIAARLRAHAEPPPESRLRDLAAWIAVVQLEGDRAGNPEAARTEVGAAERLARRNCFGCHGDLGQGGAENPGSLKGYVPGFFGRDYDLLTDDGDPDVVREWIRDGVPAVFGPGVGTLRPAHWFTARQQVKMPAYASTLRPREIETLVRYLGLLRSLGPLDAEAVARYRELRRLPPPGAGPRPQ